MRCFCCERQRLSDCCTVRVSFCLCERAAAAIDICSGRMEGWLLNLPLHEPVLVERQTDIDAEHILAYEIVSRILHPLE